MLRQTKYCIFGLISAIYNGYQKTDRILDQFIWGWSGNSRIISNEPYSAKEFFEHKCKDTINGVYQQVWINTCSSKRNASWPVWTVIKTKQAGGFKQNL